MGIALGIQIIVRRYRRNILGARLSAAAETNNVAIFICASSAFLFFPGIVCYLLLIELLNPQRQYKTKQRVQLQNQKTVRIVSSKHIAYNDNLEGAGGGVAQSQRLLTVVSLELLQEILFTK